MSINFNKFKQWAENRFDDVLVSNKEIRINSIFQEDTDHHLWCSPSGGKKKREFGVFHCFKSGKKGSLIKLVQLVDDCDRFDALSILRGESTLRELELRLQAILEAEEPIVDPVVIPKLDLPSGSLLISDLGPKNWWRNLAEEYLLKRKIPIDGLFICTEAPYKARIIIPYYGRAGELIYWNARAVGVSKIKYLGPPKECGIGKSEVIFMAAGWPPEGSVIHLCEGEFNAKTLNICEFNGAACGGKNMSEKQAVMLRNYKLVFCLDRDKPGRQGTVSMDDMITGYSKDLDTHKKLTYVRPPMPYNDWNEMYIALGAPLVHQYINNNQKQLDFSAPLGTASDYFRYQDL